MKIAIVTGIWKRPEVFRLFAEGVKRLIQNTPHHYEVIVAGSEKGISRRLVKEYGFRYIEMPNQPLAEKMNATIKAAKKLAPDYVLCLGSDDIVTPDLMRIYHVGMHQGYDFIGVLDWYFYDLVSKKAIYWGGYEDGRKGATCGAGRLLSHSLLEKWSWRIWEPKHNHILDNSMEDKLKKTIHKSWTFKLTDFDVMALDIKSEQNMTPFELWDNAVYIEPEIITNEFDYMP